MTQNQPEQTKGKKSNTADQTALIAGASLVVILLVFQWFQSVISEPVATMPPIKMPNPNAYDSYLKAFNSIQNRKDVEGLSFRKRYPLQFKGDFALDRAEKLSEQNQQPLMMLRQGMTYDFVEPSPARYFKSPSDRMRLIALNNLLIFDAVVKAKRQDWQGIVSDELDRMQFIKSIVNSDVSNREITNLTGWSFLPATTAPEIDRTGRGI